MQKKMLALLVLVVYIFASTLANAAGITMRFAQINKDANDDLTFLYAKPQDDASITLGYNGGAFLMMLDEANGWYHFSIGNQHGYMRTEKVTAADSFSSTASLPVALVKPEKQNGWVNLRKSPSTKAKVLDKLYKDKEIIELGISDEWCHVMVGNNLGYIKREFIKFYGSYRGLKSSELKTALHEPADQQSASVTSSKSSPPQLVTTQTASPSPVAAKSYQIRVYTLGPSSRSSVKIQQPEITSAMKESLWR